ncbi:phage tail protein, partial [Klebsiella pneumoniae]|nr:phage tail protein [Klebsiella pneumoniae]
AAQGTNSTQIANTAFVKAAITALINGAPGTLDTLKAIAAAINNDPNYSTTINNALALKAPLASPALTGVPTAPTAAQGTNNTQIATT